MEATLVHQNKKANMLPHWQINLTISSSISISLVVFGTIKHRGRNDGSKKNESTHEGNSEFQPIALGRIQPLFRIGLNGEKICLIVVVPDRMTHGESGSCMLLADSR